MERTMRDKRIQQEKIGNYAEQKKTEIMNYRLITLSKTKKPRTCVRKWSTSGLHHRRMEKDSRFSNLSSRKMKRRRTPDVPFAPQPLPLDGAARRSARLTPAAPDAPAAPAGDVPASVLVQFRAVGSDAATGPTLDVPTTVSAKQLEQLLNQLLGSDEPMPYSFYLNDEEIVGDLAGSLTSQALSGEAIHSVRFQPLAVFRVSPVSRCTDTLPGHADAVLHVSFRFALEMQGGRGGGGGFRCAA
jgi:hypothetical protein